MAHCRSLVIAAALLVAAPLPALAAAIQAGPGQPSGLPDHKPFWLPVEIPDHLPGVDEARAARTWVSGFPLIRMGALRLYDGSGSEGGAQGRALELKYTGSRCKIYVDSAAKPYPSDNSITNTAVEFDQKIWPNNTATFGNIIYNSIDVNIINIDGPWGIGGYFTPANPNSIYMDCADINSWGYQIVAHEFEHLIHNQKDPDEELWLNEGCADLAIAIIYGQNDGTITGHVDGFEQTPDNDLTVFQNQMYDYGSAYAFIQYFWDHFGGQSTIKDLVADKQNGISGIDDTLQSLGYQQRFDDIFPDWCVASRINDRTIGEGQYGYSQLAIQVSLARQWSSPPATYSSDVRRWAADCYQVDSGNGLDLLTDFCGTKGTYAPHLYAKGLNGLNSTVRAIDLDASGNGSNILYGFGRDYSTAILFTPSSSGGNYAIGFSMVDRSPPSTRAIIIPETPNGRAGWYTVTPRITLSPSEAGSTFYWWDAPPEQNYTGTFDAPEGNHTLYFYTVDSAQNREQIESIILAVDTILPRTCATVTPPEPDGSSGWYRQPPTVQLEGEDGASIIFRWDGGEPQNYTGQMTAPEGRHILEYYSVDWAGNKENTSQRFFMVDSSAPQAWVNVTPSSPDGLGGWYRNAPHIELATDEPDAKLLFTWDNGDEMTYLRPVFAPEGSHRFYYRARDQAGNNGTLLGLTIKVDSEAPTVTLVAEPRSADAKNGWYKTRPSITLQVADADPAASAFYSWDGGDFRAYTGAIKPLEGTHTLRYYASDTRGNRGNESSRTFKVDSVAPVTVISIDPPGVGEEWYLERPTITLSNSEGAEIWYWWDGQAPELYAGPLQPAEGGHELGFQSRDAAGNTEKPRTATFNVDSRPPEAILSISNTTLVLGEILGADGSESTDDNGIEAYSIDFGDGYRKTGATRAWDHQYDAPGTYTITLKVKDVSGQWSEPVSANVTVTLPPRPAPTPTPASPAISQSTLLMAAMVLIIIGGAAAIAIRRRADPQ